MKQKMEESQGVVLLLLGLFISPSDSRYYLVREKKSWSDAQSYCREKFTDLVTVYGPDDNQKVFNVARKAVISDSFDVGWIGLHDNISLWKTSQDEDAFVDTNADFPTWLTDQPDNLGGSQFCVVYLHEGFLNDVSCDELNSFICYDAEEEPRFVFNDTKVSWRSAESHCREQHSGLASVRTREDQDNIQKMLQPGETNQSWVGLYRDPWPHWSDGKASTFSNWGDDVPDNYDQGQFCAGMTLNTGTWNDRRCDQTNVFICYKETPLKHQTVLRMRIRTDANMTNAELQQQLLEQLHANALFNEQTNFKIHIRSVEPHRETYDKIKDGNVTAPETCDKI